MSHWLLTVGHVHRLLWSICQSANCCNRNVVSKQFVFLSLDQINFDFWFFCLSLRRVAIIDTYSQLLSHYNFDHIQKNHYITTINMLAAFWWSEWSAEWGIWFPYLVIHSPIVIVLFHSPTVITLSNVLEKWINLSLNDIL